MELAAEDVAEEVLDEAAREGVASAAQAALREAKNEELQRRLHHESKMSAAEDVCESITGTLSRPWELVIVIRKLSLTISQRRSWPRWRWRWPTSSGRRLLKRAR